MIKTSQFSGECAAPNVAAPFGRFAIDHWDMKRMFLKLSNAIISQIPVGYEDENGFHPGVPPLAKKQ